ncbi:uncharacterized protein BXZ73DRAFT_98329 [Epithele typhae]|uniref:uncharacterized protein n=1 Tax=Epithele typhae TaxID=378194 RepID=UPI002007C876|nr:uncharacterized protein BXZ73DRAFT_98329 [Epithele typhae]KAH9941117.1 hypothetical protein BXZ73DRAFT_98329 [Epithele typhae]
MATSPDAEPSRVGAEPPPIPPDLVNFHTIYGYRVEPFHRDKVRTKLGISQDADLSVSQAIYDAAFDAGLSTIGIPMCNADINDLVEGIDGPQIIILAKRRLYGDGSDFVKDMRPYGGDFEKWKETLGLEGDPTWMVDVQEYPMPPKKWPMPEGFKFDYEDDDPPPPAELRATSMRERFTALLLTPWRIVGYLWYTW